MQSARVGLASILLQASAFGAGAATLALEPRFPRLPRSEALKGCIVVALFASLLVPLLVDDGVGPHRWVSLGGVRLYIAPLVIPPALLLLGGSVHHSQSRARWAAIASIITSLALLLQPDAAQLDAVVCASLPVLWTARLTPVVRTLVLATGGGCALAAWQSPDPLEPVPHVEGVFALAGQLGPVAFAASICAAIGPAGALVWLFAKRRDAAVLAVAVYYTVVLAHAPLLVTPVPLLGFGAGPILGYVLMTFVATDRPNQETYA
jgi:hypothetical protein